MKLLSDDARKGGHRSDLRRIGHALERIERSEDLHALLAQCFLREFGRRRTGRQHVYPDTGALQFLRPGPREVAHCRLARAVGAECRAPVVPALESGQDDRTALAISGQRLLDRENRTFHVVVEDSSMCLGGVSPSRSWLPTPALAKRCRGFPRRPFTAA